MAKIVVRKGTPWFGPQDYWTITLPDGERYVTDSFAVAIDWAQYFVKYGFPEYMLQRVN